MCKLTQIDDDTDQFTTHPDADIDPAIAERELNDVVTAPADDAEA